MSCPRAFRAPYAAGAWGAALLLLLLFLAPSEGSAQNVVLIIVDDVGAEWFDAYEAQPGNPPTPTIEALAQQGLLFRNAWAYPVCSPFRVSVYTGRHPYDHGVGHAIGGLLPGRDYVLDPTAPNLANLLLAEGYRTGAVGKWHMANEAGFNLSHYVDGILSITEGHPNISGMQFFSGHLFGGLNYFDWWKTVNGATSRVYDYATTDTADVAIAQLAGSEPFFLWVAFNAPHGVNHHAPDELLADPSRYTSSPVDDYRSMIEALDTELGRVLQNVDFSDTTVLFVADNGTPGGFLQPPRLPTHGKATVYQGGLHVPLIVAGQALSPAARGAETDALVQATDLFPTILELAGTTPPERRDAISALPYLSAPATPSIRQIAYSEQFEPIGRYIDRDTHLRAARDARYKLVRRGREPEEFYDLLSDPHELAPLRPPFPTPEAEAAVFALREALRTSAEPIPLLPTSIRALLVLILAWTGGGVCRYARRSA